MFRAARLVAAAFALLFGVGSARAEWLEASNKHFVVYGNVSRKQMLSFTDRLERFGGATRWLFRLPEPDGGASNRVSIYMVSTVGAVQKLVNGKSRNIAGFYHSDINGSFIVTPSDVDAGNDYFTANYVLFHEYAHHLLLGNSGTLYPGWLSEGLAGFLSTARVSPDGSVSVGFADNARVESIRSDNPMSITQLLQTDGRPLSEEQSYQLYARSWLATHYLLMGGKRDDQLAAFLKLIGKGMPGLEAGKQVFGDLGKFNSELNAYRDHKLLGYVIPPAKFVADPVTIRALDAGEIAMMPSRIESATGVNNEEATKLFADARRIAAASPRNAWVQRALAEMAFDAKQDDEAEAACDRALAVEPDNLMAMVYKARVHLRRAAMAKSTDPAVWREVRSLIIKANRRAPDFAMPLVLYYSSFVMAGEPPRDIAVDGLLRAVQLAPQDQYVHVMAFSALLRLGDLATARRVLAPVAFNPHAAGDNPVRQIVQLIDSGASLAAVREAADKAKFTNAATW